MSGRGISLRSFREKLRRAYPDKRYPFTRKLPLLLFAGTFRKGELKEYNGWILLEINRLKSIEEALSLKQKNSGISADTVRYDRL